MLESIQAFCAVVQFGSLTRAAKELGISTPMITRRLQSLETELQVSLLHRTTRALSLTEAGQLFHEQALEMLAHYEAGIKGIASLSKQVSGVLKIGVPNSISHLWLIPALKKFNKAYPDLKLQIVHGNHLLSLLYEGFDLVLHCGDLPDSNFYYKKIRDWHKLTCAAPSYLRKHGKPKKPEDLSQHHCLDHYDNYQQSWKYKINDKHERITINSSTKINSSLELMQLSVSGLGIVYLPDFCVQQAIAKKQLVSVLDDYRPEALGMYIVYPSNKFLSRKTKVMLEFLDELLNFKL